MKHFAAMKAGVEYNTFTTVARCERSGMLGVAVTTAAPCVGSRVPVIRSGIGAVVVQAVSHPRLNMLGMKLLELGHSAHGVLKQLEATDQYYEYRQTAVIDADGGVAVVTGKHNRAWAGHLDGQSYVVMGNGLKDEGVIRAMAEAFEKSSDDAFEERLLKSIEAGRDAGGQPQGQTSAALQTYDRQPFPYVDLRVDVHQEPVGELRRIFNWYRPLIPYYSMRAVTPTIAPYRDWLVQQGITR